MAAPSSPPAMGEPEEMAPPGQDEAELDDAADLFGDHDQDEADSAAALSAAAGKVKEEHDGGTATGPPSCNSDPNSLSHRLYSVDLCEVFSPPRVGKEAIKFGMKVGDAMDLTTGWDFNKAEDRERADIFVDEYEPMVLIGSPPCVAFSKLQSLIPDSEAKRKQLAEGVRHKDSW